MAKQQDCTTSIASTQNNVIHGIYFRQHMTFDRDNHLASERNHESISIWSIDLTTSIWNHLNLQILYNSFSLKLISSSAMIGRVNIIHQSSEHCTTQMFSNVISYFLHLSHCRRISILNMPASQTQKVAKYPATWFGVIVGGIQRIRCLLER